MFMNAAILSDALSEKFKIKQLGPQLESHTLMPPEFYFDQSAPQKDQVYLARSSELPASCDVPCLFICMGEYPSSIHYNWNSEIIYISDASADLFTVFNLVQKIFKKINTWEFKLKELVDQGASLEDMLQISIPIFENRISIVDYNLRILAYCQLDENASHSEVKLCKNFEQMPDSKSTLFENTYSQYISKKEPYVTDIDVVPNYCINLFLDDKYMGVCTLTEDFRPVKQGDYALFRLFANYVQQAVTKQSQTPDSQFATPKTVFYELLQCLPVSNRVLEKTLGFRYEDIDPEQAAEFRWICIVIRSANKEKTLPAPYICSSLEHLLPNCTAFVYDDFITLFCSFNSCNDSSDTYHQLLLPYLKDMNFCAGISLPFYDIYQARSYYFQARAALHTGKSIKSDELIFDFSEYAVFYMLQNCCGQFEPDQILTPGLAKLREYKNGTEYWDTLKRYLDNESNASRTASEMFLHRTSLLPRLDKIKSFVKMDTPLERLYLRMSIYLFELMQNP